MKKSKLEKMNSYLYQNEKGYLYVEVLLDNGEIVTFAVKQAFFNRKFQYKLSKNLGKYINE